MKSSYGIKSENETLNRKVLSRRQTVDFGMVVHMLRHIKYRLCVATQASRADKLETEVRKLRERLGELEYLRSRVNELRAENHLLLEAKQQLEDQLASRDRDVTSLAELGREVERYKQLLQQATEVVFMLDISLI